MSELNEFQKAPLIGLDFNIVTPPIDNSVDISFSQSFNSTVQGFERATTSVLVLPFDIAREMYSKAVQVGVLRNSMLASRDFSQALGVLEKTTLGPWARRV